MSELRVYDEKQADKPLSVHKDLEGIRAKLSEIGVVFERWEASRTLDDAATQDEIIEAYRGSIDRLMTQYGFKSVDVISMTPNHPQKDAMRDKFLSEHVHEDFEVRFFVDGQGLFYLRKDGKVYGMLCTRGDLISVPPNTTHWFDMGPAPKLKAIRLFAIPEGWVAKFTGDKIADRFPRLEEPHYKLPRAA
jgi:1,2-dihydroxy-3-keto-5-methylthiopentene dioxygenase